MSPAVLKQIEELKQTVNQLSQTNQALVQDQQTRHRNEQVSELEKAVRAELEQSALLQSNPTLMERAYRDTMLQMSQVPDQSPALAAKAATEDARVLAESLGTAQVRRQEDVNRLGTVPPVGAPGATNGEEAPVGKAREALQSGGILSRVSEKANAVLSNLERAAVGNTD